MNTIELYPHNQKIYDDIVKAMDIPKKIFYTEATGLGKSFVLFKLIQDFYNGKRVLYIAPKIAIWNNLQSYSEFNVIKNHIYFSTYADFNKLKTHHYEYDALFIDEAHHLASDIQGANILKLMDEYVQDKKYCFGFTATYNIIKRNKKIIDISSCFDSSVFGMDMYDAIDNGLFPKIKYAIAIENDYIDLKRFNKKYTVNGTKTVLENIIDENPNINHWLAYFSNTEDMEANFLNIKKLFPDIKIFYVSYKMEDKINDVIYEFDNFNGKAVLMCVSMLLEGIHPRSVNGVLLYRNVTVSNVLIQIMGRICKIYSDEPPLLLDVTNSIYNMRSILKSENPLTKVNASDERIEIRKEILDVNCYSYKYLEYYIDLVNTKIKSYRGITWINDLDLCRKLGVSSSYVSYNIAHGKSYEEIINHVLDEMKGWPKTVSGYTFKSDADLSLQLGKSETYVGVYRRKGLSYEEIIEKALNPNIKTVSGYTFINDTDLSLQLGKSQGYVSSCKRNGKSYEEIINHVLDEMKGWPKTVSGYTFKSNRDLSLQLGKAGTYVNSYKYISACKGKEISYEEIIEKALKGAKTVSGYTFKSNRDLSLQLGKAETYVGVYRRKGLSYEEIIEKAKQKVNKNNN